MFVLNIWVCVSTALLDHFISELPLIENWWSTSQHCTVNQLYLLLSVIFQSVILSFFPYFSLRGILFRGGSATTKRFWGAIINYTKKSVWILQNMRLKNVLQLKRHCLKCTVPDFLRWQNSNRNSHTDFLSDSSRSLLTMYLFGCEISTMFCYKEISA